MASYAIPYGVSAEEMAKAMGDVVAEPEPKPEPTPEPAPRRRGVKADNCTNSKLPDPWHGLKAKPGRWSRALMHC